MFETFAIAGIAPDVLRSIGVIGFLLYIFGFAALQLEWLDGRDVTYSVINILAAAFVLVSLAGEFNLASALIQVCWITIGLSGLALRLWQRHRRDRYRYVTLPRF